MLRLKKKRSEHWNWLRLYIEDEESKCYGDAFTNLVAKVKSLLFQQTLEETNVSDSSKEAEKKRQELLELESQYDRLSMEQEKLKQKMQILEQAQNQSKIKASDINSALKPDRNQDKHWKWNCPI